jgi:GAF domain-containing protein
MNAPSNNPPRLPGSTSDPKVQELEERVRALEAELRRQEASALENQRLFAQAQARLRELTALSRVSDVLISTMDLRLLLDQALEQTVAVTGADTGSVMLIEPDTQRLRIVVSRGLADPIVEDTALAIGEGIAGYVVQMRKPLLIPSGDVEPRLRLLNPRAEIKSAMSVPIVHRTDALGVLNVARVASSRHFTAQDLRLLTTIAGEVALGVQNVRLFDEITRRNEELMTLMTLGHQLNATLNLHEVMDIIVEQATAIFDADAVVLYVRDDRHDVLRARAYRFVGPSFARKVRGRIGHGLIGDVVESGQPAMLPDISKSKRLEYPEQHAQEGIKSMLCVPLRFSGQGLGALAVYARSPRRFEEHEVNTAMALAGQGAIAIHNAENYQHQRAIAGLVQRTLAPRVTASAPDVEVGHRYIPAKQVGGDYYDVFDLPDGQIGIVMADVAGKSVGAAVHAAKGKHYIRALGHSLDTPLEVVSRANTLLAADLAAELFISAVYAVISSDRRSVRYCNAGHPCPLLARNGEVHLLSESDIVLGVLPCADFHEHEVPLHPGDTLVFTTDGVTEARCESTQYGVERLTEAVREGADLPAQGLADHICDRLAAFGGKCIWDDVAVLVVRVR